jgi:hypothetical protein
MSSSLGKTRSEFFLIRKAVYLEVLGKMAAIPVQKQAGANEVYHS